MIQSNDPSATPDPGVCPECGDGVRSVSVSWYVELNGVRTWYQRQDVECVGFYCMTRLERGEPTRIRSERL